MSPPGLLDFPSQAVDLGLWPQVTRSLAQSQIGWGLRSSWALARVTLRALLDMEKNNVRATHTLYITLASAEAWQDRSAWARKNPCTRAASEISRSRLDSHSIRCTLPFRASLSHPCSILQSLRHFRCYPLRLLAALEGMGDPAHLRASFFLANPIASPSVGRSPKEMDLHLGWKE